MKKVYIIHGYGGNPNKNWFPWLKVELEKLNVEVNVLSMPDTDNPTYSQWLSYLQSQIKNPDINSYFVGHSLGCITILQYLNNLKPNIKIGGVILVAGFASPIKINEINSFFEIPLNREKIKNSVKKIVAISSDDDPYTPYEQSQEMENLFGAEMIKIHKGGHLNEKTGYTKFPLVLEKLKQIMGIK